MSTKNQLAENITFEEFRSEVLRDYEIAVTSRECSLLGRREVLTGKAKFGIFGGGKELPQLAWAKAFQKGDFRSGYYRDQTFMMAIGELSIEQFFAGLYAHTDINFDPMSAGRQMGGHFVTHSVDENYNWKDLTQQKNSSSDISPTAAQMPRLLGLAQASKVYKKISGFQDAHKFSNHGNEVAWGSIGNASTSEGLFFETINAAGVLQVPMVISVWDDDYGISVHNKDHTTKESISEALSGFQINKESVGIEILEVKGWDYQSLMKTYSHAEKIAREHHIPVLVHVTELTQPLGHSTSGSHERYKSIERLKWEEDYDCNRKFEEWIIKNKISTKKKIESIKAEIKTYVRDERKLAWELYQRPIKEAKNDLLDKIKSLTNPIDDEINSLISNIDDSNFSDIIKVCRRLLYKLPPGESHDREKLISWRNKYLNILEDKYSSDLYSIEISDLKNIDYTKAEYSDIPNKVDGRIILRDNFDKILEINSKVYIFGEDVGKIGDVNQGLEGLQNKYGENRVFDTSIRESTIVGQGIGMSLRGLRPIAEIQYLDYILYALQILSDDLSTFSYRTLGKQKAPLIVRTRGHRLEGIWHSGSPLGGMISFLRGVFILTPRNMTKAAGFYNTLLDIEQPAIVIEPLNAYRVKEELPLNYGEFKTPIGEIEILEEGDDLTIVSYGSTLNIVHKVAKEIKKFNINCEVIDLQSLIPFDLSKGIIKSIQKTNRLMIIDEDVPGGASSYILQELLNNQNIYQYLDSEPKLVTAKEHRPPYGSDGDYTSKPSFEDVFDEIYNLMRESDPNRFKKLS